MSTTKTRTLFRRKPIPEDAPLSIAYWRERRGLTLQQLADAIGVENPVISKAERRGIGLGRDKMKALADALGIEVWQLHVPASKAPAFFGEQSNQLA